MMEEFFIGGKTVKHGTNIDVYDKNIALLIDGENISAKYTDFIIDQANRYGKINYRRIYGDWTTDRLKPWKAKCEEYGLTPVQQYSYSKSKNMSDFTLIIEAMDILYSQKVNCFCIVSSDSDFTKLVTRLKEDNIFVLGMGESKTPIALVNSCDVFSYLDKMVINKDEEIDKEQPAKVRLLPSSITPLKKIKEEVSNIIEENIDDDDWANWALVAQLFQKKYPGFHPRNYGYNVKPLTFFSDMSEFEVTKYETTVYIKNRK